MGALTDLFNLAGDWIGDWIHVAIGVFVRTGAALFLVPGLGERAVPTRVRLAAALALTALVAPVVASAAGPAPETPGGLGLMVLAEVAAGLVIGLAFRLLVLALQFAGSIGAQHLSISQMFRAGVAPEPEPTIATLLGMGGIVLLLLAGLHVRLVAALAGLYAVLPFGEMPGGGDLAGWMVAGGARVFALALSLALPFVGVGFAYNLALGALSRAMPQLLVALVGAPLLIGLGICVLWLALPEIFARWGAAAGAVLADPLGGPW